MIKSGSLKSKVGRRMTLMFLLAAFIPVSLLTVITIKTLEHTQKEQAQTLLREEAKLYALILFERLITASTILHSANKAKDIVSGSQEPIFEDLVILNEEAREPIAQKLGTEQLAILSKTGSTLITAMHHKSPAVVQMIRLNENQMEIATLSSQYLWGGVGNLPDGDVSVFADTVEIFSHRVLDNSNNYDSSGFIESQSWSLYLGNYGQPDWLIQITNANDPALFAGASVVSNIIWALILSLLIVAYLSLSQIRKTLDPLSTLKLNIERLQRGDFGQAEKLESGDEFEEVSESFKEMAENLEQSFSIQSELSKLDSLILRGSSSEEKLSAASNCARLILNDNEFLLCLIDPGPSTFYNLYQRDSDPNYTRFTSNIDVGWLTRKLKESSDGTLNSKALEGLNQLFLGRLNAEKYYGAKIAIVSPDSEIDGFIIYKNDLKTADENHEKITDLCGRLAVAASAERQQNQLRLRANFDSLTGLPNRYSLNKSLEELIENSAPLNTGFSVHFIDLNGFKDVNDSLGHSFGDQLLIEVAERLQSVLPITSSLARLGGDEFVITTRETPSEPLDIEKIAAKIIACVDKNFTIGETNVAIGAAIGIAIFPDDGASAEQLLMNADVAMYEAKKENMSNAKRYSSIMNEDLNRRLEVISNLTQAMDNNHLEWHLQPKISAHTGRIVGAEALVRWNDPELGYILPSEFIQIAEESGHIERLGMMAFEQTCHAIQTMNDHGLGDIPVAVNISLNEFRSSKFIDRIENILKQSKVDPSLIEIEITESVLAESFGHARFIVKRLRAMGMKISLDDFGTGFSSLSYLQEMDFDSLKIDRSFVREITTKKRSFAITKTIVELAHMLEKPVIAECIENEAQEKVLKELGCDYFQGYLYSPAIPIEEFIKRVESELVPGQVSSSPIL